MVVFTGKTIVEATQRACRSLNKPEAELKIQVLAQPRHGFLGIGRRPAKIEATVKPAAAPVKTKAKRPIVKTAPQTVPVQHKVVVPQTHRPNKQSGDSGELDPQVIKARHANNLKRVRMAGIQLTAYLQNIFRNLGVKTEPKITAVEAHAITVDIETPDSGRVIGHHGRRINALEVISEAFMNYHGAPKTSVILDTANYRKRRQETLHEIAERSVTEVVATGQAVFLDPMPARERKQLHKELEDNGHVRTYSHGREPYRSVVIAPKN